MVDCLVKISRQEGFQALYSGIWPAVLRQATYGTIKFGTYYTMKKIALSNGWLVDSDGRESLLSNAICAVIAGAMSSAIANPTDVLKVRMQVEGRGLYHTSLLRCFKDIYVHEGVAGLWRVSFSLFFFYFSTGLWSHQYFWRAARNKNSFNRHVLHTIASRTNQGHACDDLPFIEFFPSSRGEYLDKVIT